MWNELVKCIKYTSLKRMPKLNSLKYWWWISRKKNSLAFEYDYQYD
jgi:hypothetical protein